jgi:hypothetical protein
MTNSHVEFMDIVMKATLGDDWKDFFDLCIANSKKPLFHETENPFYDLNLYAKDLKGKKYDSSSDFKHRNSSEKVVLGGNAKHLTTYFQHKMGK